MKETAGDHIEAVGVRDATFRGIAMPAKVKFKKHILGSMTRKNVVSPSGIYLGTLPAFEVDLKRLDRVVRRVVKGLYWNHFGKRLPSEFDVEVFSEEGMRGVAKAEIAQIQEKIFTPILNSPLNSMGRGVLQYWFSEADRAGVSAWILKFYGDVQFLAIVAPVASLTPGSKQ